jgi:hypothetical protein
VKAPIIDSWPEGPVKGKKEKMNTFENLSADELDAKERELSKKGDLWWDRLGKVKTEKEYNLCQERVWQYHELIRQVWAARFELRAKQVAI